MCSIIFKRKPTSQNWQCHKCKGQIPRKDLRQMTREEVIKNLLSNNSNKSSNSNNLIDDKEEIKEDDNSNLPLITPKYISEISNTAFFAER